MKRIVILASGRGTNAEAIWTAAPDLGYEVACIITDNPRALVIEKAKAEEIPCFIFPKMRGEGRENHEQRILEFLDETAFDLIVLAGYERILSPLFLKHFAKNSIVNIHPSLLPLYPGQDAYRMAWADKVEESGCTIHYVDEGVDTGEIIEQFSFKNTADSVEEFEKLGLKLEHANFPRVIKKVLDTPFIHRVEVFLKSKALMANPEKLSAKVYRVKTIGPCPKFKRVATEVLSDSVVENIFFEHHSIAEYSSLVEVSFLPGVTDNAASAAKEALLLHPELRSSDISVYTGTMIFFQGEALNVSSYFNSWLESAQVISTSENRFLAQKLPEVHLSAPPVIHYDLNLSDESLIELSQKSLWALELAELKFVREHFQRVGRNPTDVEMEIIAQSWSEHCKHKIFAATIQHEDQDGKREIKSLFKTFIKGATSKVIEEKGVDWTRSVFTDNAGIVRWDDKLDVCIKVETHNSPSALDPYGGALTGILGVNRDILGTGLGAKPIANTNVFCLPDENLADQGEWPKELIEPLKMRRGVHKGVMDGGNKSGIPTVNGSFHYDSGYAGKPLVYCGTIGVIPHKVGKNHSHEKNQKKGDYVVMVGGRIGRDGIHGATFSSLELTEGTPSTVVQIGDPLTQKRMTDFLLRARDKELYTSITDNGAGGLSSSVGEMSQATNGAWIELSHAPVKYPGLSPAELMISESQERMTCAVAPSKWQEFQTLAYAMGVEVTRLGEFTSDGFLTVNYEGKTVAKLSLRFLFEDLPPMQLKSTWQKNFARTEWKATPTIQKPFSLREKTLALLKQANIKSHESFVRQYDHEVQSSSVTKPFTGRGGPTDAGVISMKYHGGGEKNGVAVASGLAPQVSLQDTKLMAFYSVDEAVRNAVVTGADPKRMALVDNFCWPDPLPGKNNPEFAQKLGELVRANEGLYEIATSWGMPFVSGKDSMKNDAVVTYKNQKMKISVLPTLLVTALAHIPNVDQVVTSSFEAGDDLWILGNTENLYPHTLAKLCGDARGEWSSANLASTLENYEAYHEAVNNNLITGAHDVSEGGILISMVEMAINSDRGFDLYFDGDQKLFGEGMGLIVFAANQKNRIKIKSHFKDVKLIGNVRSDRAINVNGDFLDLKDCVRSYKGEA